MRARAILSASMLSLGLGAAATNCQVFAGLTVLEIRDGGEGGAGGGTSTTATTSTTGGGGTGGSGGGPECTEPSKCGTDTTCQTFSCAAGKCGSANAVKGKPCVEDGGVLCDGAGKCVAATCMDGFENGDETDVDCGGSCSDCGEGKDCTDAPDCENGLYCAKPDGVPPGVCKPIKALGDGCLGAAECGANFCTDGVCCKVAACIDGCWTCALSGNGTCAAHVGKACGDVADDECTSPDSCDAQGICQPNHADAMTSCGSLASSECSAPDTCDGAGKCKPNHAAASTMCGSQVDDVCTDPDACDGAGACLTHNVGNGTVCGGKCQGEMVTLAGSCMNGACTGQTSACAGGYTCNAAQTACRTSCTARSDCAATSYCVFGKSQCASCGVFPPGPFNCTAGAGNCESCDGANNNTCVKTCDVANECSGPPPFSITLGAFGMGAPPSRLECGGQCNGATVTCQGPNPCEVVCGPGGCNNLHLVCDINGPCKLTCHGNNSCNGATVSCGDNACDIACDMPTAIDRTCGDACSCQNNGCLMP